MPLSIDIGDDDKVFSFETDLSQHLIDGEAFGYKTGTYCYVPVFKSIEEDADVWHVGAEFLDEHVLVFDNSHSDERNQSFSTIGLAKKNADGVQKGINKSYASNSDHSDLDVSINSSLHKAIEVD